jgi:hypothetical protein
MYEEGEADQARHLELDSTEEVRCNALLQLARYLQCIQCFHDCNVQEGSFSIGDLVLHRIQDEIELHKLNSLSSDRNGVGARCSKSLVSPGHRSFAVGTTLVV